MKAQSNSNNSETLDVKQQSIVSVSALTATGNIPELKKALSDALEAGLTVNELKEVLVQLYAYCGFPRSLNGINALISVLGERKARGINDKAGKEATPIQDTGNKYEIGKKTLEVLTRR